MNWLAAIEAEKNNPANAGKNLYFLTSLPTDKERFDWFRNADIPLNRILDRNQPRNESLFFYWTGETLERVACPCGADEANQTRLIRVGSIKPELIRLIGENSGDKNLREIWETNPIYGNMAGQVINIRVAPEPMSLIDDLLGENFHHAPIQIQEPEQQALPLIPVLTFMESIRTLIDIRNAVYQGYKDPLSYSMTNNPMPYPAILEKIVNELTLSAESFEQKIGVFSSKNASATTKARWYLHWVQEAMPEHGSKREWAAINTAFNQPTNRLSNQQLLLIKGTPNTLGFQPDDIPRTFTSGYILYANEVPFPDTHKIYTLYQYNKANNQLLELKRSRMPSQYEEYRAHEDLNNFFNSLIERTKNRGIISLLEFQNNYIQDSFENYSYDYSKGLEDLKVSIREANKWNEGWGWADRAHLLTDSVTAEITQSVVLSFSGAPEQQQANIIYLYVEFDNQHQEKLKYSRNSVIGNLDNINIETKEAILNSIHKYSHYINSEDHDPDLLALNRSQQPMVEQHLNRNVLILSEECEKAVSESVNGNNSTTNSNQNAEKIESSWKKLEKRLEEREGKSFKKDYPAAFHQNQQTLFASRTKQKLLREINEKKNIGRNRNPS